MKSGLFAGCYLLHISSVGLLEAMEATAAITAEQLEQKAQEIARIEAEKQAAQTETAHHVAQASHVIATKEAEIKQMQGEIAALQQMLDKLGM